MNDNVELQSLKMLTYNVEYYHAKNIDDVENKPDSAEANVVKAIKESNADICCLQETNPGWEKIFHRHLKELYPHVVSSGSFGCGSGMVMCKSKFKLSNVRLLHPEKTIEGSFFPAMYCECNDVRIINVHLRPPVNTDGTADRTTMEKTSPIRKSELEFVLKNLCDEGESIQG